MKIESYLFFGGNCEEALAFSFYTRCLGGEITARCATKARPWTTPSCPRSGSRR